MVLGIHYHIPMLQQERALYLPGFFGVFIDSLAAEVDQLYCFFHSPLPHEVDALDYELKANNIKLIDIGPHAAIYTRLLRANSVKGTCLPYLDKIDSLLIRAPTPLVQVFASAISDKKISLLLVGDYVEGSKQLSFLWPKNILIKLWSLVYNYRLRTLIRRVNVLTNSLHLFNKFNSYNKSIRIVSTSILSQESFFERLDTCQGDVIRLLYTGRIDIAKGILEMVEACAILRSKEYNIELDIAGWDDDKNERSTKAIKSLMKKLDVIEYINFLGKKKVGPELDAVYRDGDIYLMCSQTIEGFPRTIWEALANSMPTIATRVGSMPYFLEDKNTAILIAPRAIDQLVVAIETIINDTKLRQAIIANGRALAAQYTLKEQTKKLLTEIKNPQINYAG